GQQPVQRRPPASQELLGRGREAEAVEAGQAPVLAAARQTERPPPAHQQQRQGQQQRRAQQQPQQGAQHVPNGPPGQPDGLARQRVPGQVGKAHGLSSGSSAGQGGAS